MEYGGLGDPGPPVIPRLGRRKEQGSVTVQHLFMVGSSAAMDLQLRKFLAQVQRHCSPVFNSNKLGVNCAKLRIVEVKI